MTGSSLTRRLFLQSAAAALAAIPAARAFARVPTDTELHGLSAFGELKYAPDYSHFSYVNPDAPKGGEMRFSVPNWLFNQNPQTFNTLNSFSQKGDGPPRMENCFDSLMVRALDEPDAIYGQLASSVSISADRNTYRFRLRPEARWHDGTQVTAGDCAFTYLTFKEKGHATIQLDLGTLKDARAANDATLELEFDGRQSALDVLALLVYPIISARWYTDHPFDGSSLDVPLTSGPYRPSVVEGGRTIVYERVADYWGRDFGFAKGQFNFDRIRIDFYRERQAAFEAFKKGEIEYRQEFTSKTWATEYEFPATAEQKVVKREFPSELRPALQAWAINQRRERFADRRVREAIALCFDFEWTRENFFYGSYERSQSLVERSDYKAVGAPSAAELALLEPLRGSIPDKAFADAPVQPVSDGSGRDRKRLAAASRLLDEAGWTKSGSIRTNAQGKTLALEFLVNAEVFVRVYSPFIENLKLVGIDASLRLVDPAQYQARLDGFDFDMVGMALSLAATPSADTFDQLHSSRAAKTSGSYNLPGTSDASVDTLIGHVRAAEDRETLTTAIRALDRVMRARMDWIPSWYSNSHRVAYWDKFGFVEPKPDYGFPVEILWWHDADKAANLAAK